MTEGSHTESTKNEKDDSGVLVLAFFALAIGAMLYTAYGRFIDFILVSIGLLALLLFGFSYLRIATKHNIQFDQEEMILITLLLLLWIPVIVTPLWDLLTPSTDYISGGLRMIGLLIILIIAMGNFVLNLAFVFLYKKAYSLQKPNWVEKRALQYRRPWIFLMFTMAIIGFFFGTGLYLSLFGVK